MRRITSLVTIAVVLLGASATAANASAGTASGAEPANDEETIPASAPPSYARVVEMRGADAVATLRARGLSRAAADRAGTSVGELDELFEDQTVFTGAFGEIGHVEPPAPAGIGADDVEIDAELAAGIDVFNLHSRPGSSRTLLLDFDGHTTTGTYWNSSYYGGQPIVSGAYDIDGNPSTFSDDERARIATIWRMVAEDYAPFDVNVATADPGLDALRLTDSTDAEYGVRIVVTSTDWYHQTTGSRAGGVAYLRSVMWNTDTPGFVFAGNLGAGAAKSVGEAASHEAGHAAGLQHDGVVGGSSYYSGHGTWAPIMGVGYYRSITQWSRGDYANAGNTQDDLAEIASRLGVAPDDHPDDIAGATQIGAPGTLAAPVSVDGVIGVADVDTFSFDASAAPVTIRLRPAQHTNLAARLVVIDAGGDEVAQATASPDTGWEAELVVAPASGSLVVEVRPGGYLTAVTGFSSYASLGAYSLTFTEDVVATTTTTVPPTTTTTVPPTTTTTVPPTTTTTVPPTTTTTTTVPPTTTTTTVPPTTTTTTTVPPTTTTTTVPPTTTQPAGDGLTPINPQRLADTRTGLGGSTRLDHGSRMELQVTGRAGIPAAASAAVLSIVAVNTDAPGHVTVYPCTPQPPTASTVNHGAGATVANTTIATLDVSGKVCIYTHAGADIVVDATGWIGPSGTSRLTPIGPVRAVDTRVALGSSGRLSVGSTITVDVSAHVGPDARAAAVNITAVNPAATGHLTVWPCDQPRPHTSTLNYVQGGIRANNAIVGIDDDQRLCLSSSAATDVIVDVTGRFADDGLGYLPAQPTRLLDTRAHLPLADGTAVEYDVGVAGTGTVVAASVNVTSVGHTAPGHITTYGCGALPKASTVNHGAGEVNANGAVVPVADRTRSCIWSSSQGHVVADLLGWWVR